MRSLYHLVALLLVVGLTLGVKTQGGSQLKPQKSDAKSTYITNKDKIPVDKMDQNGDVFSSLKDFGVLGQPFTDLSTVDADFNHIQSKTLDKQKEDMINYLKSPLSERHLEDVEIASDKHKLAHEGKMEGTDDEVKQFYNANLDSHFTEKKASESQTSQKQEASAEQKQKNSDTSENKAEEPETENKEESNLSLIQTQQKSSGSSLLKAEAKKEVPAATVLAEMGQEHIKVNEKEAEDLLAAYTQMHTKTRTHTRGYGKASNLEEFKSFRDPATIGFLFGLIFVVILLIWLTRYLVEKKMEKNFQETLDGILKDIITLYLIVTSIRCLHWIGALDNLEYYVNIHAITLGFLLFAISWLVLGVYNVFTNHSAVKKWNRLEAEFAQRFDIYREYEKLHLEQNRSGGENKELKEYKNKLEYFLMRQEFISPSFLPVLGESFLRDDFNFSTYLAKCLAKSSTLMFKYTFTSLLITFLLSSIFYAVLLVDLETQWMIISMLPIVLYFLLYAMGFKLKQIRAALIHIVDDPYEVNFTKFDNIRQPMANNDKLKDPVYLQGSMEDEIDHKSEYKAPNRQQCLFWFQSPTFMVRFLHICLLFQMLFIVVMILRYSTEIDTPQEIVTLILSLIFTIANLFVLMPENLSYYSIITNIQMLKDKKIMEEVVDESKERKNILFIKLYRLLKSIARDNKLSKPIATREIIIEQCRNYYKALPMDEDFNAELECLKMLGHYCGQDLTKDELVSLARTCVLDENDNLFDFNMFMRSIEYYVDEVRQDRYKLAKETLKTIIDRTDGKVSLSELKEAFSQPEILEPYEVDQIMHEMRYLPFKNMEIKTELVARFIRDFTEGMPY